MSRMLDPLLMLILLLNFFVALGTSRMRAVINAIALQGMLLGILAALVHREAHAQTVVILRSEPPS